MNDIEILEKLLKKDKCDIGYYMAYIFDEKEKQAIENLIKENKELKDTNKKFYELCQGNAMQEFINNECDYIHKSKVKEKIEEINNEKLNYSEDEYYLENEIKGYAIDKIQELLEENEK